MSPSSWRRRSSPSVSGAILRKMLEDPEDVGYSLAAKERPYPLWQKAVVLLLCVLVGVAGTWGLSALRAPHEANAAARSKIAQEVAVRIDELDEIRAKNLEMSSKIEQDRKNLVWEAPAVSNSLARSGAASGVVAVTGPGLSLRLNDTVVDKPEGHLKDYDFQVLVNSLWASGAEAVAINGQRIGPTTAIRNAGRAVLVNLIPLNPPYLVDAVGDPTALQTAFAKTPGSAHIAGLRDEFGVTVELIPKSELKLPAIGESRLRYVQSNAELTDKEVK